MTLRHKAWRNLMVSGSSAARAVGSKDGGELFACRKAALPILAGLTVEPKGYADHGRLFL